MYQLQFIYPGFTYRGEPVAVSDIITIETEEDRGSAERLAQAGAVVGYDASDAPEPPPGSEDGGEDDPPSVTQPMTTQDSAVVGRRARSTSSS